MLAADSSQSAKDVRPARERAPARAKREQFYRGSLNSPRHWTFNTSYKMPNLCLACQYSVSEDPTRKIDIHKRKEPGECFENSSTIALVSR